MEDIKMLTVGEVAQILHKSHLAVRKGIIQGTLPFGACIKSEGEYEKNVFVIPKSRFEAWLKGELLG
jgi:hypothetical protein